jgi:cytochrome c oxidase subunit II
MKRMHHGSLCLSALSLMARNASAADSQDALMPFGVQAAHIHDLWQVLLWACMVFGVLIVIAVTVALWRATRSSETTPAEPTPGLQTLSQYVVTSALVVSIIGLLGLTVASVMTDRALAGLSEERPVNVKITSHNWWWEITYEDAQPSRTFMTANELHIPAGRPVIATLESDDVIHSFWVPNLHGKRDLIPGRTAKIKFRADSPGSYRGQCAEFCGYQHAHMALLVIAEPAEAYEKWADRQRASANTPAEEQKKHGESLFLSSRCAMCHSIQGTSANGKVAPDLTHVGSRRYIAAGTLLNGPSQLAAWISDPQRYKPGANMPGTTFSSEDLQALVTYLQSLT